MKICMVSYIYERSVNCYITGQQQHSTGKMHANLRWFNPRIYGYFRDAVWLFIQYVLKRCEADQMLSRCRTDCQNTICHTT